MSSAASVPATDPGGHSLSASLAVATVASTGGVTALIRSPLVRRMLEVVLAEPVLLSPDERYLHGHYLAYLLSGSRRRGLFLRRPLEPRNADRGRLLLGLTYAISPAPPKRPSATRPRSWTSGSRSAPCCRRSSWPSIWPAATRPAKRKLFRQTRKAIGQASTLRPEAHDRRQGRAQPRLDAAATGGPAT